MVVMNPKTKMPGNRHCPRIDTLELKLQIERKIGQQKAEKYFNLLSRFLSLKVSKSEFDTGCRGLLGRENIALHNGLLRAIVKNATVAKTPPPKQGRTEAALNEKVTNGCQRSSLQSICRDVFPQSPRKGRTPTLRDRKLRDRPSPLGPHGKTHSVVSEDLGLKIQEQQSATELLSLGSRPPVEVNSVEDGEEVEQAAQSPGIYSRTPVTAPLGISLNARGTRKAMHLVSSPFVYTETCWNTGELPDTGSLRKRLERKLETEGLNVSTDCVNLLNNGLDVFMKRLVKPSLYLATSRAQHTLPGRFRQPSISVVNGMRPVTYIQKPSTLFSVSMLDFRVAMEMNPWVLGEDWPVQLEKVSMYASEDYMAE